MNKQSLIVVAGFLMVLVIAAAVQAGPIAPPVYAVGNNMMSAAPTQLSFAADATGAHWNIQDSMGRPLYLYQDPSAGPLQKTLTGIDMAGDQFSITEHFRMDHGPAWTDWHEQFVTSSAIWIGTPTLTVDDTGDQYQGVISGDGRSVDFYFSPISAGMTITIDKQFTFSGGAPTKNVMIQQWPTTENVPEPGTFALLAVALAGGLAYAWRKRR